MKKIKQIFLKPTTSGHRQYEALRAIVVDGVSAAVVAKKYNYCVSSLYSRIRDLKSGSLTFFPEIKRGPKNRRTPELVQQLVLKYRKENWSAQDIKVQLEKEGYHVSSRTVERILTDAQMPKLKRRSMNERDITLKWTPKSRPQN